MVYIYVCKRFKVTMDMISGRDCDWVNNLLQFYCKHGKISGKLERAEINPKKRTNIVTYDSSADVFKINIVYKDSKGAEHELKWVIKVTRSDVNETADFLLRHEKQVYARLMGDLMNTVKQRAVGRMEGARISFKDLIHTPDFIYEEVSHQADLVRNVLVLDNLEEKDFYPLQPGPINLCHMRMIVKTVAKFHAVSLAHKQMLFASFTSQLDQAKANRQIDEVVMEGDNRVLTGRHGLFSRFPFLSQRQATLTFLIQNRAKFFDMYQKFLECFPEEEHLIDIFEYIRISTDDILLMNEDVLSSDYQESHLDAITLGVLESRSFLFRYEDDEDKENERKKKNSKLQRSQSERIKDKGSSIEPSMHFASRQQSTRFSKAAGVKNNNMAPASPKCPKLDHNPPGKMRNKFLQNVIGKSKDDENVPLITTRKSAKPPKDRDPNQPPKRAAIINAKYVTYGRITRDLAVLFWTSASTLIRRFYLIKMLECYVETLGITLGQMGIDTDSFQVRYMDVITDFQQHILYGFLVSVLNNMATTSPEELDELYKASKNNPTDIEMTADDDKNNNNSKSNATDKDNNSAAASSSSSSQTEGGTAYLSLTLERVEFLRDLMRDIGAYVESKDFEQNLPITNFSRYHEIWSMFQDDEDDDNEYDEEGEEAAVEGLDCN